MRARFEDIVKQGKQYSGKHIKMFLLTEPTEDNGNGDIIYAVTSKVRTKPRRNRIKRLMRESVRLLQREGITIFRPGYCSACVLLYSTRDTTEYKRLRLSDVQPEIQQLFQRVLFERKPSQ
jgi:RNase P protein component